MLVLGPDTATAAAVFGAISCCSSCCCFTLPLGRLLLLLSTTINSITICCCCSFDGPLHSCLQWTVQQQRGSRITARPQQPLHNIGAPCCCRNMQRCQAGTSRVLWPIATTTNSSRERDVWC